MSVRRPLVRTTVAAIGVIVALTLVFAAFAIAQVATLNDGRSLDEGEVVTGLNQETATNATWLSAGLILIVCLLTVSMAIGLARRRTGARYAAMTLFLFMGCVAFAASLAGAMSDPPAGNAGFGMLCGLVNLVIVVLLAIQPTADDFDQAEVDRLRRMARG